MMECERREWHSSPKLVSGGHDGSPLAVVMVVVAGVGSGTIPPRGWVTAWHPRSTCARPSRCQRNNNVHPCPATRRKTVPRVAMPAAIEITPRGKNARDWTDSEGHMMDGEGGTGRHSLSPVCLVSPVLTSRPPHLSSLSTTL
ncbi:hypothetical protein E2C01_066119 [Portunus trituberculatus]|uniref:Uncharacterized protein n=1 Tax=Portunus trituberculatus TaxID=210409 RepID=A0A5B7HQ40_PORTR|nr:hypothetical protein [Portunus trituberculatus]